MKTFCYKCGKEFEFDRTPELKEAPEKCPPCVQIIRQSRWEKMCPASYRETELSRIPNKVMANRVLAWKYGSKGLMVHGGTDKGKTRAVFLLLKRLHFDEGREIMVFLANEFAHDCSKKFMNGEGEDWIKSMIAADVVFFDDLGKSKLTERVESELFGVIEMRTASLKPTIITTNFIGSGLSEKMTEDRSGPFLRRIREFCDDIGC